MRISRRIFFFLCNWIFGFCKNKNSFSDITRKHHHLGERKDISLYKSPPILAGLQYWITNCIRDFNENSSEMMLQFLRGLGDHGKLLELLMTQQLDGQDKASQDLRASKENVNTSESVPTPVNRKGSLSTKNLKIWKISVDVLARQIALIEFDIFKTVQSHELSESGWKKKDGDRSAPSLLRSIRRFNEVSAWVASEIIGAKKSSSRIKRAQLSILIAKVSKPIFHLLNLLNHSIFNYAIANDSIFNYPIHLTIIFNYPIQLIYLIDRLFLSF